ncbi:MULTISPECIES: DNA methyltransferase [Vibrio]|uniref:DNA methyltransferase n=1 Tax=Vibrio TaxID=662 RepID=UPI000C84A911|nr:MULTISPECIES: DNA methyltransferase [Vibrio]PMG55153.1 DNA methylase [Vibrio lentus]PTO69531.1 DNA methylase [Vibrio splendidus]
MKQENLFETESEKIDFGPVECLGLTFESDEARRAYFIEQLRDKLKEPEFKTIEGFPIGTDEAILKLSDPPYYTACPNPWLDDFIQLWENQKEQSKEDYHCDPFTADVSEGKNDPIYNAHSYHTKVPHKAIMRYILHYTRPGDIVFDGFCGTGMTGVASKLCGNRNEIESLGYSVDENGTVYDSLSQVVSKLGARKAILGDLSPIASFISSGYNVNYSLTDLKTSFESSFNDFNLSSGWLYQTLHNPTEDEIINSIRFFKKKEVSDRFGVINFTVMSEVFSCSECAGEIIFYNEAFDSVNKKVKPEIECPSCGSIQNKKSLNRVFTKSLDMVNDELQSLTKLVPTLINYTYAGKKYTKKPDAYDREILDHVSNFNESWYPTDKMMFKGTKWGDSWRAGYHHGFSRVHHFYTDRELCALADFWDVFSKINKREGKLQLLSHSAANAYCSKMRRFRPDGKGGGPLAGTLYVSSIITPPNVAKTIERNSKSIITAMDKLSKVSGNNVVNCRSMASYRDIKDNSIDYIFLDPPFGGNLMYSELNFMWESWLQLWTKNKEEAIENNSQGKGVDDYRDLMEKCFNEAYRILKPGRWLTVEFSNTQVATWNSIQMALKYAGFVIANVSALDKKQGSYKSIVSPIAVKQDLIISAYKPNVDLIQDFSSSSFDTECVWRFVSNHLKHLPITKVVSDEFNIIPERESKILYDKVVSYYFVKGFDIPISSKEFKLGLENKYVQRDGMFFLPEQIAEYDKKRAKANQIKQFSIFVDDEASAIEWMGQELKNKPKTYSEIHPLFLNELSGWKKNELELELSTLLEQNFLNYDGKDDVPSQIHTYLSTNFKDMRGLDKCDSKLVAKAKDRWYVPDPNKAADLEKVRLRALLKEFETYKAEKKKIKQPRAEALRAGFNTAWETQDFQIILDISAKIPPAVLQEDEKLLMFYDNALTLTSTEDDEW